MNETDHILIAGSGFAGLGMGIQLKAAGIEEFTILEQADRVGGTWRDNSYPGAACDIESHLYSFSFEQNPGWTRTFASQPEIEAYLERCVETYDLAGHLELSNAVTGARFDEASGTWLVETSRGPRRARVLVAATGGLSRPSYPDIEGLDRFGGPTFHSARWDHDCDLSGKRVAVIGTGASAIQIVPSIAPTVKKLHVYQRTAPWILPKADRPIAEGTRRLYRRLPGLQRIVRAAIYLRHELLAYGFVARPALLRLASRLARRFLERSVADPELRVKLLPHYVMGCKRVLLSNDYYPAICRDNVELVTSPIVRVAERGVVTDDGVERPIDALVLATGFQAAEVGAPFPVRGRAGMDLDDAWKDGPEAYLGTTVHGFPNLFIIVGPNTGLGHSSMVFIIESQIRYIVDAVREMRVRRLGSVEVREEVQRAFNDWLTARFPRTVWDSGCASWYRTKSGRNTTLWPGFTFTYRQRTRRFDLASYLATPLADRAIAAAA